MKLRSITAHDVPASVGWQLGPRQTIFAVNEDGYRYVDPANDDEVATTTAWFGFTTQPRPR